MRPHEAPSALFWLGAVVLLVFVGIALSVLYGGFLLFTRAVTVRDVAVVSAVSGLAGSILGYAAGYAQQVIGFFFGSSQGSRDKTEALTEQLRERG